MAADNASMPVSAGKAATREVSYSGELAHVQAMGLVVLTGSDDAKVAADVATTAGLPVDMRQVGGTNVNATPVGFQRVSDEPRSLFYDPFESLDTTHRWTITSAGGGVAPAVSVGRLSVGSGTTANGRSYATSLPTFLPSVPGWLGFSFVIKLESPVGNNAVRFWGMGTVGGTPTSTNPLGTTGNGMGFELDTSGVLNAVLYSNGTRTVISALPSNQPTNTADHRYIIAYRTDRTDFYIDGLGATQLVATSSFLSPAVQVLSSLLLAVAHTPGPASSCVIDCAGLAVWDTAKGNTTISDPTYGWRRAGVAAKNFQSQHALQTQHTKDVGRNARNFLLDAYADAPSTEALQSVVQWYGNAAVAGTTTPAVVPAGKTLRLTGWSMSSKSLATAGSAVMRVRANIAGTAVIGSPIVWSAEVGSVAASATGSLAGALGQQTGVFPEGFEFPAGTGLGFSLAGYNATGTLALQGATRFAVHGYEY